MTESEALRRTLGRRRLPAGFVRWRVTLDADEERPTDAAEWAGALVLIERGLLEVHCLEGGFERFEAGDLISLGWLPLQRLHNPGSGPVSLLAVRRSSHVPTDPFLRVERRAGREAARIDRDA